MAADELTSTVDLPLRNRPVKLSGGEALGQRSQINFPIELRGPADHYFDHTRPRQKSDVGLALTHNFGGFTEANVATVAILGRQ